MTKDNKNYQGKKFEFLLLINGHIVCQRYFGVKEYNQNVTRSYNLKECVDRCVNYITGEGQWEIPGESTLKGKTWEYLWNSYNPYLEEYPASEIKNIYENEDMFTFQIKVDGKIIIEKAFSGNDYPPKVRYDVNIRGVIPQIITDIQETLGEKKLQIVGVNSLVENI